jgi:hypothetical protein
MRLVGYAITYCNPTCVSWYLILSEQSKLQSRPAQLLPDMFDLRNHVVVRQLNRVPELYNYPSILSWGDRIRIIS